MHRKIKKISITKSKTTKEIRRETRKVIGLTSILLLLVIFGMTAL